MSLQKCWEGENIAIFKELSSADIKSARSFLNQLVDVIQLDLSGSTTRKKYQVWVSGGQGPGVTSSLFQTVYDQDFTLQTSNPIFDTTVGLYYTGSTVNNSKIGTDAAGKFLFNSSSLQMREKVNNYKQFSQVLLGNNTAQFAAPFGSTVATDAIDAAFFVAFKRLFARDAIKRETFALKFYQTASVFAPNNLKTTTEAGSTIYTDIGSSANKTVTFGGNVGNLVDSSNTARTVGLLFYDRGIAVFDLNKITSGTQQIGGIIDAMNATGGGSGATAFNPGQTILGSLATLNVTGSGENPNAKVIPDLMVSGSIDNIVDHLLSTRFSSGSLTACTFQNITNINSTLIFCHAGSEEANYSSNPTYLDASNRIVVIDPGQEDTQTSFTYVSSVGLYDSNNNLLAIAKLSRPVQKSAERDLTFRIRLDF